jgi:nitrogen regulatory protein PII
MKRLVPEKLLTIIADGALEAKLTALARKSGVSGYTVMEARGAGSSGEQSGNMDIDTNIMFKIILPESRVPALLDAIEKLLKKSYKLKVFVSDVAVLMPQAYEQPLDRERP